MNCRCHLNSQKPKKAGFILLLWQVIILKSKLIYDDI